MRRTATPASTLPTVRDMSILCWGEELELGCLFVYVSQELWARMLWGFTRLGLEGLGLGISSRYSSILPLPLTNVHFVITACFRCRSTDTDVWASRNTLQEYQLVGIRYSLVSNHQSSPFWSSRNVLLFPCSIYRGQLPGRY